MRSLSLLLALLVTPLALAAPHSHLVPRVTVPQSHYEVLSMRQSTPLNPRSIIDTECIDRNAHIVFHDQNAAELSICGGIEGSVQRCAGNLRETSGRAGSALFMLRAVDSERGATIDVTKERWEQCVRAARAVCPTGSLRSVCIGAASSGNVAFSLEAR